jgi:hypothetical protein
VLIELDENRGQAVVYEVTPDERSTDLAARGWARAGAPGWPWSNATAAAGCVDRLR